MSVLTQNERDGLDDVFSSIHSSNNKYKYIKELSAFIISKEKGFFPTKLLKQAKYGIKQTSFSHFLSFTSKKKKKLSK
ncbi:MAG: hypothetical protein ACI9TV_001012 [Sulfurimonas sp.]|jgi:hypothetical protein|uniref:hypothetical protein n=1 Tax=Sulfurimonas sp. TaxID=2022749 RepID=UPI0039E2662D